MDPYPNSATAERIAHCRATLAQIGQMLEDLNQTTHMEAWSPEIGQSYRMVLYDISALDAFLLAYRMESK